MFELLQTIALLCQVSTGADWLNASYVVDKQQLTCQKEYLICMAKNKNKDSAQSLVDCIMSREVK